MNEEMRITDSGRGQLNQPCIAVDPLPLKPRHITIETVLNGYCVSVGCQRVVFETKDKMLAEISRYLDKPLEVEKEYSKQ